jgi:hypothetical protein
VAVEVLSGSVVAHGGAGDSERGRFAPASSTGPLLGTSASPTLGMTARSSSPVRCVIAAANRLPARGHVTPLPIGDAS